MRAEARKCARALHSIVLWRFLKHLELRVPQTISICSCHLHLISNQTLLDYNLVTELLMKISNASSLGVPFSFSVEVLSGMEASMPFVYPQKYLRPYVLNFVNMFSCIDFEKVLFLQMFHLVLPC